MSTPPSEPEPYVSAETLAAALGVPRSRVYEWVRAGRVPSYLLGSARRFRRFEVEAALASDEPGPEEQLEGLA